MKIVYYPHPALRHKSRPLAMVDKDVRLHAGRMLELMYESRGLGLAANQVAWPVQLFVMNDVSDPEQKDHEHVLINPVVVDRKGTVEAEEGCLSFPDLYQKVRRARTVTVQAYDLEGKQVELTASDLPSRVMQHEIDHLHGNLFIDNMGMIAKLSSRGPLASLEADFRKAQKKGEYPPDEAIKRLLAERDAASDRGEVPPPIL